MIYRRNCVCCPYLLTADWSLFRNLNIHSSWIYAEPRSSFPKIYAQKMINHGYFSWCCKKIKKIDAVRRILKQIMLSTAQYSEDTRGPHFLKADWPSDLMSWTCKVLQPLTNKLTVQTIICILWSSVSSHQKCLVHHNLDLVFIIW